MNRNQTSDQTKTFLPEEISTIFLYLLVEIVDVNRMVGSDLHGDVPRVMLLDRRTSPDVLTMTCTWGFLPASSERRFFGTKQNKTNYKKSYFVRRFVQLINHVTE